MRHHQSDSDLYNAAPSLQLAGIQVLYYDRVYACLIIKNKDNKVAPTPFPKFVQVIIRISEVKYLICPNGILLQFLQIIETWSIITEF